MPSVLLPSLLQPQVRCVKKHWYMAASTGNTDGSCSSHSIYSLVFDKPRWHAASAMYLSNVLKCFLHLIEFSGLQAIYSCKAVAKSKCPNLSAMHQPSLSTTSHFAPT